jgi:hypothetical protein
VSEVGCVIIQPVESSMPGEVEIAWMTVPATSIGSAAKNTGSGAGTTVGAGAQAASSSSGMANSRTVLGITITSQPR